MIEFSQKNHSRVLPVMSFSGFGKSHGPSTPPGTQTTFGRTSDVFKLASPNLSPSTMASFPDIQKEQQQQSLAVSPQIERSATDAEMCSPNAFDEAQNRVTFIPAKPASIVSSKRARSPLSPVGKHLQSPSLLIDSEREMQAKAKRLARFNIELLTHNPFVDGKIQAPLVQQRAAEPGEDATYGVSFSEFEGIESSKAVIGLCSDMCPELERDERERKGDLDKHERLNGDRNQTSKFLAVKKYNRMAEREPKLIRPIPVLQKTVDYLLSLLDQPYDNNILNIYNFLWDRLRAVRMDLRMQHIFDEDAVVMLEQMIRLHIIAMHELCEFERGEGFTEGFDAHLNIEQMNKTSVELFQLYDDHRKSGKCFVSEKEFRGYYALFKLDKHPGYKVEPAELSLDLAKMTPEIRSTREILFARDVARVCRIGNYIAFFRLARNSTYLQSCLMHAHFSKMRKQALASLHSGLQSNQGIPIAHVKEWLAMEGEDVESLLEYHGFSIRRYVEQPYMVKEGPFLSSEMDFPTRCALLVQHKRSKTIADDVRSAFKSDQASLEKEYNNFDIVDLFSHRNSLVTCNQPTDYDEMILDNSISTAPMVFAESSSLLEDRLPFVLDRERGFKGEEIIAMTATITLPVESNKSHDKELFNGIKLQVFESNMSQPVFHQSSSSPVLSENSPSKQFTSERESIQLQYDRKKESEKEMMKLILRKWKTHAAMKRKKREQKDLLAIAALSLLSVGPPCGQIESQKGSSFENLDFNSIARARRGNYGQSWSRLNISELVAPIMVSRNPRSGFFCWKLVLLLQSSPPNNQAYKLAADWLSFKICSPSKEHDPEMVVRSFGLSIWKKYTNPNETFPQTCCISVIRENVIDERQKIEGDDALSGVSSLAFLVSETIPWEIQRARLQNILLTLQPGSKLPLLILCIDPPKEQAAEHSLEIIRKLSVGDEKEARLCSSSVIFLTNYSLFRNLHSFFDDHQLRVGLQWLAQNTQCAPSVHLVRTRDLVLSYLRRFMEVNANLQGLQLLPNYCIAGFNKAIDESAEEITASASMNRNHWPAPELDLLSKSSNEGVLAGMHLPTTGWSSPTRIDPLVKAVKSCKLPTFPDTFWPNLEPLVGEQIMQQKLALEKLLISYLNESNIFSKADFAAREACIMLQKYASLKFCGTGHCLVLSWLQIFMRIYTWKLNILTAQEISYAYIAERKNLDLTVKSALKDHSAFHSFSSEVSLDELIEISCCKVFKKGHISSQAMPCRTAIGTVGNGSSANDDHDGAEVAEVGTIGLIDASLQISDPVISKTEGLNELLERCNRLQDMIDQKLTVYF